MPFRHPDRSDDLDTRIAAEVRERLEEAIDYVCLEALVQGRRARGLPAPEADNAADRREYNAHVLAFIVLLERELTASLTDDQRGKLPPAPAGADDATRRLAVQVSLARLLPDYWQRFDVLRARYLDEPAPSRSEGGGLLARLFRRG